MKKVGELTQINKTAFNTQDDIDAVESHYDNF